MQAGLPLVPKRNLTVKTPISTLFGSFGAFPKKISAEPILIPKPRACILRNRTQWGGGGAGGKQPTQETATEILSVPCLGSRCSEFSQIAPKVSSCRTCHACNLSICPTASPSVRPKGDRDHSTAAPAGGWSTGRRPPPGNQMRCPAAGCGPPAPSRRRPPAPWPPAPARGHPCPGPAGKHNMAAQKTRPQTNKKETLTKTKCKKVFVFPLPHTPRCAWVTT